MVGNGLQERSKSSTAWRIPLILSQEAHGGRLQNYAVMLVVVAVAGPRQVV